MKGIRIALAQVNPTVGDLKGNTKKIIEYMKKAKSYGARIVAFPEMAVTGYPPEDLLLKPHFLKDNLEALDSIREHVTGITAVVGFVDYSGEIYNAAAVMSSKKIIDIYHKSYLPNYGVFDEFRYFQAGRRYPIYDIEGTLVGVNICEDIWYPEGPVRIQALSGAELILNINASPYTMGKSGMRDRMLSTRAVDSAVIVAYLNTVGGQDELIFDGGSVVFNENGEVIARARQFEEELLVVDLDMEGVFIKRLQDPKRRRNILALGDCTVETIKVPANPKPAQSRIKPIPANTNTRMEHSEEVYSALCLGVADYVGKNGFKHVAIGLSGGVDSALVTAIAVDSLGAENVTCLFMPSPFTSKESREDSMKLAENLRVKLVEVPIEELYKSYLATLKSHFKGLKPDTTEENLQARIRGNILMAFSNKMGWLVLTTGNKSEMSVGYATLYGDMAGGFAVIKDVPKTLVYELCRWRNQTGPVIPERILWKDPSAELKPNQKDTDSLPPYSVLDPVLNAYIEKDRSFEEIVETLECDPECARKVIGLIDVNEYKRRQSPPGIKISPKSFGRDRRLPITNKYRDY